MYYQKFHVIFDTPVGCTSITIAFWTTDDTDHYLKMHGVSLKAITESFAEVDIEDDRVHGGTSFGTYVKEYTKIVGNHSVIIEIDGTEALDKVGVIQTGLMVEYNDPKETMSQGLQIDSPYVDLKYGGRLIVDKYNLDVFDCELVLASTSGGSLLLEDGNYFLLEDGGQLLLKDDAVDSAEEFMFTTFPAIRLNPRFMILGSLDTQDWSLFCRFEEPPIMTDAGKYKRIRFRLIEAI